MIKGFMRRFLPFMLSVVMTVEMIPATAFAAEVDEVEEFLTFDDMGSGTAKQLDTRIKVAGFNSAVVPYKSASFRDGVYTLSEMESLAFKVYVNGEDKTDKVTDHTITYSTQWQKAKTDGEWVDLYPVNHENAASWAELSGSPTKAGKYLYSISVEDTTGVCSAASLQIPCEITKQKMTVHYDNGGATTNPGMIYVLPGSKVQAFIDTVKERVRVWDELDSDQSANLKFLDVTVRKGEGEKAELVGPDDVFQSTTDYYYSIEPVLKDEFVDDYEISARDIEGNYLLNRGVIVGDAAPTRILVTAKSTALDFAVNPVIDENNSVVVDPNVHDNSQPYIIGKQFDGNAIDVETDILSKVDVAVEYDSDSDPQTSAKWIGITDDDNAKTKNLSMEWWDSGCSYPLGKAPADAGTYTLCISYKGKEGIYKSSGNTFVRVKIKAQEIYVKPKTLDRTFYTGMTVQDVIGKISYQVLFKADDSELEIDPVTFWGVAVHQKDLRQSYAPLFGLRYAEKNSAGDDWEKDGSGNIIYAYECDPTDMLDSDRKYIAVFTGNKAIFNMMGDLTDILPVNEKSLNSACSDYDVLVDDATLSKNFIDIKVEHAYKTEVDVTGILKDGKGKSFSDPIVNVYSGEELYKNRAEYKKAVVKNVEDADKTVADNANTRISYIWQVLTDVNEDADGNPDPCYEDVTLDGTDKKSPFAPGSYRLEITYSDPAHMYASSVGYVYYEIRHQFVMAEPAGSYAAYAGTTIGEFLDRYRDRIECAFYKVADNVYQPAVKGEAVEIPADSYRILWSVECSDDGATYTRVAEDDRFDANPSYRYRLRADVDFGRGIYADHYTDYSSLPAKEYLFNVMPVIQVEAMGDIAVTLQINADSFSFDPEKSGQVYKEYDGEAYSIGNIDELITVTDSLGQAIADFPKDQLVITWHVEYEDNTEDDVPAPKDAGSYSMSVFFPGNGKYKRSDFVTTAVDICRIGRCDLTVTPVVKGSVKAGNKFAPAEDFPISLYQFDGAAESDKDAFTYRKYTHYDTGFRAETDVEAVEAFVLSYNRGPVYHDLFKAVEIYDKDGNRKEAPKRYRGDMEYYACTKLPEDPAGVMAEPYRRNYRIVNAKGIHRAVRVGSRIFGDEVHLRTETLNGVVKIIPSEGLPYCSKGTFKDLDGNDLPEGNYFTFKIEAPAEFNDPDGEGGGYGPIFDGRILLKNAIKNAGGTITLLDSDSGEIKVVFPVTSDTENAVFEIVWQDIFTEKFEVVLSKALLCSDTSKAVLPKSMKFNGASSKMAVGEVQQLNLTVVKKQISDVIRIGYSVSDSTILSVTGNGSLTALKTGKATVSAYPIKIVDDKEIPITGGKVINLKITVGSVAKPAVTKVTALDNVITVRYKKPSNGYRREFYVLEGKKTVDDFETAIEEYDSGASDDVFAIRPLYGDGLDDGKPGALIQTLGGRRDNLEHDKEYTVYVRNVSGARTMYNGSMMSASYAGTVKTVRTTKENVWDLELELDEKYAASSGVDYEVPFSQKSVTASIYGLYHEYLENPAAEATDLVRKTLPLSKEDKETYVSPKISCYVTDAEKGDIKDAKTAKACGYTVKIGSSYYYPSKIASVTGKGKLTLKGLGKVRVWVYNSTKDKSVYKDVKITADVNAFTGKTGKAKVGQRLDLNTLLVYQAGGKKVTGNPADFAAPHPATAKDEDDNAWFIDNTGMFVAKKKGKYTVKIEDAVVAQNGGTGEASVTINVSDMDPVKELKKVFVYDAYAKIRFTYSDACFAGMSSESGETVAGVDFRVDVRDSAGKLVYSQFLDGDDYGAVLGNKREYYYVIDGLSRRSSYKVQVTAFSADQQSKAASLAFKTTGVPASYIDMNDINEYVADYSRIGGDETWYRKTKVENAENGNYDIGGKFYDHYHSEPEWLPGSKVTNVYQGVHIDTWGITEVDRQLDSHPFFTSGSSYVLSACEDDLSGVKASELYPKEAKSDTLVWKVKDTKIASVKALKGSFSAKLKAGKPGTTTLEVSSKNTKKVIARYRIMVKPVGDGHDYFGDYDDYYNGVQWDPAYEKSVEMLYVGNPLTIEQADNEYVWVRYEAKESGVHTFEKGLGKAPGSIMISDQTRTGKESGWDFDDLCAGVYLYEGMQLYMKVEGSIEYLGVSCTHTVCVGPDNTLTVKDPLSVTFTYTAKEAGCYTFSSNVDFFDANAENPIVRENSKAPVTALAKDIDYNTGIDNAGRHEVSVLLKAGVTIRMKVRGTNETKTDYTISVTKREYTPLTFADQMIEIGAGGDIWLKFEAPDRGEYVFMMSGANTPLKGYYYTSLNKWKENYANVLNRHGNNTDPFRVVMQKGDNIAFRLTPEDPAVPATASVKMLKFGTISNGSENVWENVGDSQERWYTFTAPEDGIYGFRVKKVSDDARNFFATEYTGEVGDESNKDTNRTDVPVDPDLGITEHRLFTAGQKVVFKIHTDSIPDTKVESAVSVKISKCEFLQPGADGAVVFDEDGFAHYKLTAPTGTNYKVLVKSGRGNFIVEEAYRGSLDLAHKVTDQITINEIKEFTGGSGESLYFILQQTSTEKATGAITMITEMASTGAGTHETTPQPFEPNETKWFSYTVADAGRYYISSTSTAGTCAVTWYYADTDTDTAHNPNTVTGEVFKAGQSIYIKVVKDEAAGDVNVKIEKVVPAALTAGASVTAIPTAPAGHKWYQFAPADGLYQLDYTITGGTSDSGYYEKIDDSYDYSGNHAGDLQSGISRIIRMDGADALDFHFYDEADGAAADMSVSSKIVGEHEITGSNGPLAPVMVTLPTAGQKEWFRFKATADGLYTFATADGGSNPIKVDAKYFVKKAAWMTPAQVKNRETYIEEQPQTTDGVQSTLALQTDDEVLISITRKAGETYTDPDVGISVSNRQIITIYAGEPSGPITFNANETKYVQFRVRAGAAPYPAGVYFIKSRNHSPAQIKCMISIADSATYDDVSNNGIFKEWRPSADYNKVYQITTNSAVTASCRIYLEEAAANLVLNETTAVNVEKGRYAYAFFTAPTTNWYTFQKETNHSVTISGDSFGQNLNASYRTKELWLERGSRLLLKIDNTSGTTDVKEEITVTGMEPEPVSMTEGSTSLEWSTEVAGRSAGISSSKWYIFKAGKTAKYTFKCAGSGLKYGLYNEFPDQAESVSDTMLKAGAGKDYYLAKGEVIYIRAENSSASAQTGTIRIWYEPIPKGAECLAVEGEDNSFDATGNTGVDYVYFTFTPEEDGFYDFILENKTPGCDASGKRLRFYPNGIKDKGDPEAEGSYDVSEKNESICNFIPAGKTVVLRNHEELNWDFYKVNLIIRRNYSKTEIVFDSAVNHAVSPGEYGYDVFRYNVLESGYYKFYITHESLPYKADGIMLREHGGGTIVSEWESSDKSYRPSELRKAAYLKEGEVVFLVVFQASNENIVYDVDAEKVED